MCYVIVTCRSLLWTLMTIIATLFLVVSVCSPHWMIGHERKIGLASNSSASYQDGDLFRPTVGIFNRCYRLHKYRNILHRISCDTYVTRFDLPDNLFPNTWKAALIFYIFGVLAMIFTTVTSVISLCMRSLCGKSIFTLSGLIQSIAGLFCLIGLILYPAGWGTERVQKICGDYASPFNIENCSLGWSFYLNIASICLIFTSSVLSVQADQATTSQKVEEEILTGKNLICVV